MLNSNTWLPLDLERCGVELEPNGDLSESEGVLNPGSARTREGQVLLYPRMVAPGNVSRVGIVARDRETGEFVRRGFALEPAAAYELRTEPGGYGCEDPRVTFIAALDCYVMVYAAYGPLGPRLAVAVSPDGFTWQRLGMVHFAPGLPQGADKDAAFFPEPVISPNGVPALAMYHRPMSWTAPPITPQAAAERILAVPPLERECIRIAYIPLESVQSDMTNILNVSESVVVVAPDETWGRIKVGAGTAPIKIADGWFSLYHAVDVVSSATDKSSSVTYTVGAVIHDVQQPHLVKYRSPKPIMMPQTEEELRGTVDNVVFPTAIETSDDEPGTYDVYYGMADTRIGRLRLRGLA